MATTDWTTITFGSAYKFVMNVNTNLRIELTKKDTGWYAEIWRGTKKLYGPGGLCYGLLTDDVDYAKNYVKQYTSYWLNDQKLELELAEYNLAYSPNGQPYSVRSMDGGI